MSENSVVQDFVDRYTKTKTNFPNLYNSYHEAIGVILEEYKELEKEVFTKEQEINKIYAEAIDLASAAFVLAVLIDRKKKKMKEEKNDKVIWTFHIIQGNIRIS